MLFIAALGLGIFTAMVLLCCLVYLAWEYVHAADEHDVRVRGYAARHAVIRVTADDWLSALRPAPAPEPSLDTTTLPRLTDTGELRAVTDAWIAEHCPGEGT